MPNGGGQQLLENIRKHEDYSPRFFLVTGASDLEEQDYLAKGADGVFSKPFEIEEFVKVIRNSVQKNPHKAARTHF